MYLRRRPAIFEDQGSGGLRMHGGTFHLSLVRGPEGRWGSGGHFGAWRFRPVIWPVIQRGLVGLLWRGWCCVLVIPVGHPIRQRKTVAEPVQPGVPGVDIGIARTISHSAPAIIRIMRPRSPSALAGGFGVARPGSRIPIRRGEQSFVAARRRMGRHLSGLLHRSVPTRSARPALHAELKRDRETADKTRLQPPTCVAYDSVYLTMRCRTAA